MGLSVANKEDTITLVYSWIETIIGVMLALMGIVFTGYAFFQALINDNLLMYMLLASDGKKSKLQESNEYFAQVMMLQFVCFFVDLIIWLVMTILPSNWVAFDNQNVNILISGILIGMLMILNLECIWETKSFIFNIFQLFNVHAFSRMKDIFVKLNGEEKEL